MNFNEIMYTIQNKPYFKVNVTSHGRIVKKFTQLAGGNDSAEAFFLINKELKCTWWKPATPIIDGLQFITYADLSNAIPLKITKETVYENTEFITKTIEITTISEDVEKQITRGVKDGLPDKLVEIHYPPDLLYQIVDAHFVTKILTPPPEKFDFLNKKWLLIIGAGIVIWYIMSGGKLF